MKVKFVILIMAGVALLIGISYMYTYNNYVTYVVPIKNVRILEGYAHVDPIKPDDQRDGPYPLKKFEYVEEYNSIIVTFGGGVYRDVVIPDFSYVERFHVNQTFVFRCLEEDDLTFLGFYKYLGTTTIFDEKYLLLWHFEGEADPLPCNYPDVIIHSIDVVDMEPREGYLKELHQRMNSSSEEKATDNDNGLE